MLIAIPVLILFYCVVFAAVLYGQKNLWEES